MEIYSFDFDKLSELAATNPTEFEHQRQKLITEFIHSAPAKTQQHLVNLQHHLDKTRAANNNPLLNCTLIFELIHLSLLGENGLTEHLIKLQKAIQLSRISDEDTF